MHLCITYSAKSVSIESNQNILKQMLIQCYNPAYFHRPVSISYNIIKKLTDLTFLHVIINVYKQILIYK